MKTVNNPTFTDEQGKVFGSEARRLRKDAGFKLRHYAELVGVSENYLCKIEHGRKSPSLQLANRIADSFGVTVEDMLKPVEQKTSEDRIEYGRKLYAGRMNRGFKRSIGAGALGIPVDVYVEFERGECSIADHQKELLNKLLDIDKEPTVEVVTQEVIIDIPIDVCDVIIGHVKDLKVDSDTQKKVWRYFTDMKTDAEERRLFGKTGVS